MERGKGMIGRGGHEEDRRNKNDWSQGLKIRRNGGISIKDM